MCNVKNSVQTLQSGHGHIYVCIANSLPKAAAALSTHSLAKGTSQRIQLLFLPFFLAGNQKHEP